ncbi:hypothetical protein RRG08_051750 [Elysia crispata]|uniref:Uncharacterized protein n=1 Tax=Elysia crispata TaxID=231223 RepID=A0AAE1EEB9_9GAST|nr:hypothetical protein RRG08_051750 [Elysia crispata]
MESLDLEVPSSVSGKIGVTSSVTRELEVKSSVSRELEVTSALAIQGDSCSFTPPSIAHGNSRGPQALYPGGLVALAPCPVSRQFSATSSVSRGLSPATRPVSRQLEPTRPVSRQFEVTSSVSRGISVATRPSITGTRGHLGSVSKGTRSFDTPSDHGQLEVTTFCIQRGLVALHAQYPRQLRGHRLCIQGDSVATTHGSHHGNSRSQPLYPGRLSSYTCPVSRATRGHNLTLYSGGFVATRITVSRQLRGLRSYTPSITATRGHRLCIQGDSVAIRPVSRQLEGHTSSVSRGTSELHAQYAAAIRGHRLWIQGDS